MTSKLASYDVLAIAELPQHYFVGMLRLFSPKDWPAVQRREEILARGNTLMSWLNSSIKQPQDGDGFYPEALTQTAQMSQRAGDVAGEYRTCDALASIVPAESPIIKFSLCWTSKEKRPPHASCMLGLIFSNPDKCARTYIRVLSDAVEHELKAGRALRLDWDKIPVRALTDTEVAARHCNLAEFQKRTNYFKEALIS